MSMLVNDVDGFFEMVESFIENEIEMTDDYTGKVFALANKGDEGTHVTMIPIGEKNFENKIKLFAEIKKTKEQINHFNESMIEDGLTPIAYCHTEIFIIDDQKRIVYLGVKVDGNNKNIVIQKHFKIVKEESLVNADGSVTEGKTKCVETDIN